ncbi:major facilitator superfamily domain-containing protein 1-like [Mizuhopecten yessoensis]|uniref:Lysosomal dipeptide transporter MFSD1 n=1 Tax=Mizuhopecten yessoensis TaxID=6573 RepID=A0A210PUI7_MIZYE|nr:major facilitator superfamily domain-containing protein 1-like [Mizuhopecten yessoensis]XP_021374974.1 major facilitator superfamily domain-containing protein 1-like [Mizuhopecten yessoensis]XP_021374975.1 major facilitator superfamily domain-containing protein 1-like [Mizuhopecten yessoensis]OWF40122.1 Major facilitator superfamily domain-containing protein 1 [Mizuhopecten yessoensis]
MKPHEWKWRYAILFCDCVLVFGVYFCVDMPSSLQVDFVAGEEMHCHGNESMETGGCCDTCLGLGPQRYNLLHSFLYWTSSVLSLLSGYCIDRIGNRVSAVLIIILTSLGSNLFAIAGTQLLRNTSAMFPLMIIGRMLLGFGDGPMRIVQDRVVAHWFAEDSVLAVSLVILTRRGGTLLNFLLTANIAVHLGFTWALWIGAVICSLGIIAAFVMGFLDVRGTNKLDDESQKLMASRPIKIKDITNIPKTFWIHVSMIGFHFCSFFSFVANGSQYIQLRHGYSKVMASYTTGAAYIGPVFFAPVIALLLKRIECNGLIATFVTTFSIPIYLMLAYCPAIPPVVLTVAIGAVYTFDVIIMWQVTINLLPPAVFGTGAGIGVFVMRFSIGLMNLAVGSIVEDTADRGHREQIHAYQNALMLMTAVSVLSVACGVLLNILDIRNGDGVNKRFIKNKPVEMSDTTELVVADKLSKQYNSNDTGDGTLEEH